MTASTNTILDTAKQLIAGSRAEAYGSFSDNAKQQAELWNAYLADGKDGIRSIEPMDVPAMMILVKLMRLSGNTSHQDSWVDIAGFAGLAEQVHDTTVPPAEPEPARKFKKGDRVKVRPDVRLKYSADGGPTYDTDSGFEGVVSHYSDHTGWVSGWSHGSKVTCPVLYVDRGGRNHDRIAVPELWVRPSAEPLTKDDIEIGDRVRVTRAVSLNLRDRVNYTVRPGVYVVAEPTGLRWREGDQPAGDCVRVDVGGRYRPVPVSVLERV